MKRVIIILVICFAFLSAFAQNRAKIDAGLGHEMLLREAGELIRINIILDQQYDPAEMHMQASLFPTKASKRAFVIDALKRFSTETQQGVMTLLADLSAISSVAEIESLWIVNLIHCYATAEAIGDLSLHPDVSLICFDKEYPLLPEEGKPVNVEPTREIVANVLKVNADKVWALGYEGEDVVVAVIDSGVNYSHNDLQGHLWEHPDYPYHGWDFVNNDNNPKDDYGHGTHCAGTVAGDGTSGSQTGVAPKAAIMAVKVLNSSGSGTQAQLLDGIQFAVDHGADVLSMSMGFRGGGTEEIRIPIRNAMINTLAAGIIASVAAGNEGIYINNWPIPNNIGCPANCPPPWLHPDQTTTGGTSAVVCVGATDNDDAIAFFSSLGPVTWQDIPGFNDYPYDPGMGLLRPDVCAPGVEVKSLAHYGTTGYVQQGWSGTSMATPCVAGTMALLLSKNPELTPAEICEILETTAVHLPNSSSPKGNTFGSGRIDALAAINATQENVKQGIVFEGFTISDSEGNNNGRLNPGETAHITVTMKNGSDQPINDVILTFSTTNGLVTVVNGEADFGDFAAEEVKTVDDAFTIAISEKAISRDQIICMIAAAFEGVTRKTKILLTVHDFIVDVLQLIISDKDNIAPGETSDILIYLRNTGNEVASNLTADITTASPYLTINAGSAYYGQLHPTQYKDRAYNITLTPETPSNLLSVPLTITITEESGRETVINRSFYIKNSGQPPASCNPIEDLSVEITSSNALLTWTAPSGANPDKYLIYCNDTFLDETISTTYQTPVIGEIRYYCVEALYSDGCTSALTCAGNTSVVNELHNHIKIYPNPTTGELTICDMRCAICDVTIFDVMGRTAGATLAVAPNGTHQSEIGNRQSKIGQSQITFDLSNVPTGIYFVRITTETGVVVRKVVKVY